MSTVWTCIGWPGSRGTEREERDREREEEEAGGRESKKGGDRKWRENWVSTIPLNAWLPPGSR